MSIQPPAHTPCAFCPYRQDAPSGVWDAREYAKLPPYDAPTYAQPTGLFQCHLRDRGDPHARVCAGWAGCHDGNELLALRIAVADRRIAVETADAVRDYVSPVPLWPSGAAAAAHGMRRILDPSPGAQRAIDKISRLRGDLTTEQPT